MRVFGQLCLLGAFVSSGYAAFACLLGWLRGQHAVVRSGVFAAVVGFGGLTATVGVLGWALVAKDFSFKYVTQYSSWLLGWHYSLSALWVGQAGSLLLWAWFSGLLALTYFFWPRVARSPLREGTLGVSMAYVCFLLTIMVFGADPMQPSLVIPKDGAGLGPLLHHPAMLVHPPIVFLGYAAWTIPFALAVSALVSGRLDTGWVHEARPWSLFAWAVLGTGIVLGASWAYEELGWGGYWGWDPVENGSLIPWLTGSALLHSLMAWRYRGVLKKSAVSLALATFGLCNFATFLTRSGIFSSVHAFSQSPIGWMFLVFMAALAAGGGSLVFFRRRALVSEMAISSMWTREAFISISAVLLLMLAAVTTVGTVIEPVSKRLLGRSVSVGPDFYNNVLIPTGIALLLTMAAAPVLRWGRPPTMPQRKVLVVSIGLGLAAGAIAALAGVRHPIALAVAAAATLAGSALVGAVIIETRRRATDLFLWSFLETIVDHRREYAGFLIHAGFVCLAIGVTGSSLGTRRQEVIMSEGETMEWAGRTVRYVELIQRELPEKLVAEALLEVSRGGESPHILLPARHLHLLQNEWTTEVAIQSSWAGDFYTILNSGEGEGQVSLTFVDNPLMRWIWLGGGIMAAGAITSLWPFSDRIAQRLVATPHTSAAHPNRRELAVVE